MKHVHILGICGTFMAGVAALGRELGYRVTGSDAGAYPPMSTQLEALGIEVWPGFDPAHLDPIPDQVIVGNVISRGNPALEHVLNRRIPYTSGPAWLSQVLLQERWVIAVAGTHGKTTTSSLVAWILDYAGLNPGFLIGGVPKNFGMSARLGEAPFFVVEADEYDTAFCDKRSKFVHYQPQTAILNNLEFDHADIFADLAAIEQQFHHLVRTIPGLGQIIRPVRDASLDRVLAQGCWTPVEYFDDPDGWQVRLGDPGGGSFSIWQGTANLGTVNWDLRGQHNACNALAALLAARHAGVAPQVAIAALSAFAGVARRLDFKGEFGGIHVYDDFAHHPTAIAKTIAGIRGELRTGRLLTVFEPRSNSMRLGSHLNELADAFGLADAVYIYTRPDLAWDASSALSAVGERLHLADSLDDLAAQVAGAAQADDRILIMSNGDFGGFTERLIARLPEKLT